MNEEPTNNHKPNETKYDEPRNLEEDRELSKTVSEPTTQASQRMPWYNQGWAWMIIAAISILILWLGFSWISDRLFEIGQFIEQQTEAVREQTDVIEQQHTFLQNIREGIDQLIVTIETVVQTIIEAVNNLTVS